MAVPPNPAQDFPLPIHRIFADIPGFLGISPIFPDRFSQSLALAATLYRPRGMRAV
jgi:hypothetical protein